MTYHYSNLNYEIYPDELYNIFDLIRTPLYNACLNKNKGNNIELINFIDLNIINIRKFFPKISKILNQEEVYKEDLFYDFMNIRSMSTYIFDKLEKIRNNNYNNDLNPYLDTIYGYLTFVDILLEDFHEILNCKNYYLKGEITILEYNKEHKNYKDNLNQYKNLFYQDIYDEDIDDDINKSIKEIWSKEYVKGEYFYK